METIVKIILMGGLKILSIKGVLLKPFSTDQLKSLNLSREIMHGFCLAGKIIQKYQIQYMPRLLLINYNKRRSFGKGRMRELEVTCRRQAGIRR